MSFKKLRLLASAFINKPWGGEFPRKWSSFTFHKTWENYKIYVLRKPFFKKWLFFKGMFSNIGFWQTTSEMASNKNKKEKFLRRNTKENPWTATFQSYKMAWSTDWNDPKNSWSQNRTCRKYPERYGLFYLRW